MNTTQYEPLQFVEIFMNHQIAYPTQSDSVHQRISGDANMQSTSIASNITHVCCNDYLL